MRKQINGLAVMAEQSMECQRLRAGAVSVLQRRATDPEGVVLGPHRVLPVAKEVGESIAFPGRATMSRRSLEIDTEKLRMLLDGIDFWSAHQAVDATQRVS